MGSTKVVMEVKTLGALMEVKTAESMNENNIDINFELKSNLLGSPSENKEKHVSESSDSS
jgi:hypothetical protein